METNRIRFKKLKGQVNNSKDLIIYVKKAIIIERSLRITMLKCPNEYSFKRFTQFLKQHVFNAVEAKDLTIYVPNDYIRDIKEVKL